ncbi:MAG: hypothetical protein R3A78_05595 [Polyangiales bacterium]|nr:hypothetical protein [Myxococcales bacterium]
MPTHARWALALALAMFGACAPPSDGSDPLFVGRDAGTTRDGAADGPTDDGSTQTMCNPDVRCAAGGLSLMGCGLDGAATACPNGSCVDAACCASQDDPYSNTAVMYYANWTFPQEELTTIRFTACPKEVPDDDWTFVFYQATAGAAVFEVGVRRSLSNTFALLKRFGAGTIADMLASEGSAAEVDPEGAFIRVVRPVAFAPGACMALVLRRGAAGTNADWFDLDIESPAGTAPVRVGSVLFPRDAGPATFNSGSGGFIHFPGAYALLRDTPRMRVDLRAEANANLPTRVQTLQVKPNVNIQWNTSTTFLEISAGGSTAQCVAAGQVLP